MRPGIECLLEILREQRVTRVVEIAEWEAALVLAEEEHVLPWAVAHLRLQAVSVPPAIADRFAKIERDAAIAAFYWCSELKGVLRALGQSDILAVPLKGPFLAERLYGSAALRVSRDLDLLVRKADLPRAEAVLAAAGFIPGASDDYHRPWQRRTTVVELHHDVENPLAFNFHVEGAIERARPAVFQGERCWQLAPDDELLFLCLHGARHRFELLSLILDLQLAFEKLADASPGWHLRPEVAELSSLLTLGLAMVSRLQPNTPVTLNLPGIKEQNQHLEDLADRLWQRLLSQPCESLNWRTAHAFFVEIEPPGWPRFRRHCRHLRILAGRAIGPDYEFAARFGLHRTWQVRMLRPFRLLSDLFRRQALP
ncbi:MAG: nucleotidyltransferase family protein [Acidobacteriaceae bacterium]|jgi:hypothetical protein